MKVLKEDIEYSDDEGEDGDVVKDLAPSKESNIKKIIQYEEQKENKDEM